MNLRELMAKASPRRSGDELAGIAAANAEERVRSQMKLAEPIPELAQLVAASPFDAALHDAYGRLHGLNSFDTLSSKFMNHDLSEYLDIEFKGDYLDKYTLREPKERMPLYHLVGALDPLTKEMIYVAVSATNQCGYCIASHTAGARKAGMTDAMFGELMAVVGMANESNRVASGYQVEIDEKFLTR